MVKHLYKFWPFYGILCIWVIFSLPYLLYRDIPFPTKYLVTFFPPWNASYAMPVKNNAMPDIITQIYPWKYLTIQSWKSGNVPLWNPYSFSGTAHAANYQTAVFTPVNIFFFLLPFVDAWSIMILMQSLFAAVFMYLFLRCISATRTASFIGSLSFMFCGFLVVWMAYGTLGYAILYLPLLLFSIRMYTQTQKVRYWILQMMSILLSLLSGHFQISVYLMGYGILFSLFEVWRLKSMKVVLPSIVSLVIAIGLAMPQLLPSIHAFYKSVRAESFGTSEVIPWHYYITVIAPDFYGNPVTRNDWYGHYAEWSSYIGVIPLVFSLYGLMKHKTSFEKFLWLMAIIAVLSASPSPLNKVLYALKIPVLSTSSASRIIVLASFSLAALSAFGFMHVQSDWKSNNRKYVYSFAIAMCLVIASIWIFLFLSHLDSRGFDIAKRNFVLPSGFIAVAIIGVVVGIVARWLRTFIIIVFLVIILFDVLRYAAKWMPFESREYLFPKTKTITYLQETVKNDRIFGNIGNEVSSFFQIPLIEGYDALYQKRYGEFIGAAERGLVQSPQRSVVAIDKYGIFTDTIFRLLGVKYILHRISDGTNVWAYPVWELPENSLVYRDEHYELYENSDALPRVYLASSYILANENQQIIDVLMDSDTQLSELVVLEQKPQIEPEFGFGETSIYQYSTNYVMVKTKSDSNKLLFLSDVFDDGWQAYINGTATNIYRANYAFRALLVPKGIHDVIFIYRPLSFLIGCTIFIFSIGLCSGYLWLIQSYENRFL